MTTAGGLGDWQLLADIFGSRPAPPTPREADGCLRRARVALRSTGHGELAEQLAGATATVTIVAGNQQTVDVSVAVSAAGLDVVGAGAVELHRELAAALHRDGWAMRSLQVVTAAPGRPALTALPKRVELIGALARHEGVNRRVRLIVNRAYGFHSANAALGLIMLALGPITHVLPHERVPEVDP